MDIFLVRVRQRADSSLFLEYKPHATTTDNYIAISHVWGSPDTIVPTMVDGAGVVNLSPGKKDILSILRREDVCGRGWFWMDLFCITQDETATISITDQLMSIPHVYKSSRCVKILFEHPICEAWQTKAVGVLEQYGQNVAIDAFLEEEIAHSRRCPHMPFFDPWFERLWTRQEGLYGQVLDVIALNVVPCGRLVDSSRGQAARWAHEGAALARRSVAEFFLHDKLAYHGVQALAGQSDQLDFDLYTDLLYRRHLNMGSYGGVPGPAATYSPVLEAWRSNRTTAKERDYVLAVFPDIGGYIAPPGARKMPFSELLMNALSQPPIRDRFDVVAKVPHGLIAKSSSKESISSPWAFPHPQNIGEAYDTLTIAPREPSNTAANLKADNFHMITREVAIEDIPSSAAGLPELLELCARTMDGPKQMTLISPTGPCTGTDRGGIATQRGLMHRHLVQQFAPGLLFQHLPARDINTLAFRSVGADSSDAVKDVPDETFGEELRRYLVCMVCGTSLRVADAILGNAAPRVVATPYGKLLAVLRKAAWDSAEWAGQGKLLLLCPPLWFMQGFLVAQETSQGAVVIGRTVVPSGVVWDAISTSPVPPRPTWLPMNLIGSILVRLHRVFAHVFRWVTRLLAIAGRMTSAPS